MSVRRASSLRSVAMMSLLVEQPTYVLDLARRYEERFGDVIPINSTSAFYRTVDSLVKGGMLEPVAAEPSEPRRQVYRATADGARTYMDALTRGLSHDPARLSVVTRMLSAAATGGGASNVLAVLDSFLNECLAQATSLEATPPPSSVGNDPEDLQAVVAELLQEQHRLSIGVQVQWAHMARKRIKHLAEAAP